MSNVRRAGLGESLTHGQAPDHIPAGGIAAEVAPARGATPYRLIFALFTFLPIPVMFIVPLAFYRVPMVVVLSQERLALVGGANVARAVAASLVWLAVAAGLVLWPGSTPRRSASGWKQETLWQAFLVLSIGGSTAALLDGLAMLPLAVRQPMHLLAQAPTLAVLLGAYVVRTRGRDSGGQAAAALWTLIALDLIVDFVPPLTQARVAPVVFSLLAILYGLMVIGVPGRSLAVVVLLLVPIVAVMIPAREYVRARAYGAAAERQYLRTVDSSDLWRVGLRFRHAAGLAGQAEFGLARLVNRLNRLGDFAYVVQMTPSTVPYANGVTYAPIVTKLVPRVFWKSKPSEIAGQYYGHRYSFLDPTDTVHSDNLPMITEGWMNFGWIGVLLSAAVFGIVLRVIWMFWIGDSAAPASALIGAAIVGTASDIESNLSLVLGGVVYSLLACWLIVAAIGAWDRRRSRPPRDPSGTT